MNSKAEADYVLSIIGAHRVEDCKKSIQNIATWENHNYVRNCIYKRMEKGSVVQYCVIQVKCFQLSIL